MKVNGLYLARMGKTPSGVGSTGLPVVTSVVRTLVEPSYAVNRCCESDTTITTVDIDGVNMLAIQALAKRTEELKSKTAEIEALRTENGKLAERLNALEEILGAMGFEIARGRALSAADKSYAAAGHGLGEPR